MMQLSSRMSPNTSTICLSGHRQPLKTHLVPVSSSFAPSTRPNSHFTCCHRFGSTRFLRELYWSRAILTSHCWLPSIRGSQARVPGKLNGTRCPTCHERLRRVPDLASVASGGICSGAARLTEHDHTGLSCNYKRMEKDAAFYGAKKACAVHQWSFNMSSWHVTSSVWTVAFL